jgi:NADPH-dependent 2,4-dienoyl-CoA reductase/sulfur reductase-like enzyme
VRAGPRRSFIAGAAAALAAPALARAEGTAKVVVIGGGFGGATCARVLKRLAPEIAVTLVEPQKTYAACPGSSEVIVGARDLARQQFGYDAIGRAGVTVAATAAKGVDASARTVALADGNTLAFDRLVMAPGIDLNWAALPGYDEQAAEKMPHAWKGGEQIALLGRQLKAMPDGGLVVIAVPAAPYRCPPAPYERASLIAWYLKAHKPRSRLLILDAKDSFSQQRLFQQAWAKLYPGVIEWVALSQGGNVTAIDASTLTVKTDFDEHKAQVANIIPPQKAAAIANSAGVADHTGWCPVEPVAFESTLVPAVHVLGDSAIMGAVAKGASGANAQAKACAGHLVARLGGRPPAEPQLSNTCFSLAAPDYGFSITGVYRPEKGQLLEVPGSGATSPLDADQASRAREANAAQIWYETVTAEIFR